MPDNLSTQVIPQLLHTLSEEAPSVKLKLKAWDRQSIDDLGHGRLDLAISIIDVQRANLYHLKLSDIHVCAVLREGHPLVGNHQVSLDDFLQYPFMVLRRFV